MSTFDTEWAAARADYLAAFGENIVYRPKGGTQRTISATVTRFPPRPVKSQGPPAPFAIIEVMIHGTLGIGLTELDLGGDQADISEIEGGTTTTRQLTKLIGQSGGMLKLEVR